MSKAESDIRARLRHEARHLRALARQRRSELRALRTRPIGQRDPIAELRAAARVSEYVLAARQRDAEVAALLLNLAQVQP